MNRVKILDCTLRDGGYVNNWNFGKVNLLKIINNLVKANVDIIECGFLTNKVIYDENNSRFDTIENIMNFIPRENKKSDFVCMINYGEYNIQDIPNKNETLIDGIRVAFHKKDLNEALEFCKGIVDKGYKLFIQPMVSVSYSDIEFINLIKKSNEIKPYAFYIVDSFGVMKRNDLMRLFYLVDHNLSEDIHIGYHSHNNLQLSFSNAQSLIDLKTKRKLIIDSSVFGMGRGAGNLNTELFMEYLNDTNGGSYYIRPVLKIIDEVLNKIYYTNYWGYSLPHYISAKYNCHPNYASYLSDKDTLTIEDISNILSQIDSTKKNNFDKEYIEELYLNYQKHCIDDKIARVNLREIFNNKNVVVIAPGKSINENINEISSEIDKPNTLTVSINFKPNHIKTDFIFISNLRRYEDLKVNSTDQIILTSNIKKEGKYNEYIINYIELLNDIELVKDNAGLMLIKLLISLGVKKIKLAGFDGYTYNNYSNYFEKDFILPKNNKIIDSLNDGMREAINYFSKQVDISFITDSLYLNWRKI